MIFLGDNKTQRLLLLSAAHCMLPVFPWKDLYTHLVPAFADAAQGTRGSDSQWGFHSQVPQDHSNQKSSSYWARANPLSPMAILQGLHRRSRQKRFILFLWVFFYRIAYKHITCPPPPPRVQLPFALHLGASCDSHL